MKNTSFPIPFRKVNYPWSDRMKGSFILLGDGDCLSCSQRTRFIFIIARPLSLSADVVERRDVFMSFNWLKFIHLAFTRSARARCTYGVWRCLTPLFPIFEGGVRQRIRTYNYLGIMSLHLMAYPSNTLLNINTWVCY